MARPDPLTALEAEVGGPGRGAVLDDEQLAALAAIRREALDRADRAIRVTYDAVASIRSARAAGLDHRTDTDLARVFGVTPQMVYRWHRTPGTSSRPTK